MVSEGNLTAERPAPVSHKLGYRHDATLYAHSDVTETWRQALVLDKLPLKLKQKNNNNTKLLNTGWNILIYLWGKTQDLCTCSLFLVEKHDRCLPGAIFLGLSALFQAKMEVPVRPQTSLTSDQLSCCRAHTSSLLPRLQQKEKEFEIF